MSAGGEQREHLTVITAMRKKTAACSRENVLYVDICFIEATTHFSTVFLRCRQNSIHDTSIEESRLFSSVVLRQIINKPGRQSFVCKYHDLIGRVMANGTRISLVLVSDV